MDGSDHMDGSDPWKDRPMDGANPMQPEDPMHGSNPMSGSRCYARISVDEVERNRGVDPARAAKDLGLSATAAARLAGYF